MNSKRSITCAILTVICTLGTADSQADDELLNTLGEHASAAAALKFPDPFAVLIDIDESSSRSGSKHIIVFRDDHHLDVAQLNDAVQVSVTNPEYGGIVEGKVNKGRNMADLLGLDSGKYSVSNFWSTTSDTDAWAHSNALNAMTNRYFTIGSMEFHVALAKWREAKGSYERSIERGMVKLAMRNWPIGDDGNMAYFVEPETSRIVEIEATFNGIEALLQVNEFAKIEGVEIPKETTLTLRQPAGQELVKTVKWELADPESVGFQIEMCRFDFYNLPPPDLEMLPERPGRLGWYIAIACGLVAAGVLWKACQHSR